MSQTELPIAVIGAGPVGLAAAARLIARGLPAKVYEAGDSIGANVRSWGHVRLFSPWEFNVDPACRDLLAKTGWRAPADGIYPTGFELLTTYLEPLAAVPEIAAVIEVGARVEAIGRLGIDKVTSRGREDRPFTLRVAAREGNVRQDLARAVIDASGTWTTQNPLGSGGMPADGEERIENLIVRGIPDVLGYERATFAGRKVAVVGAGHSAANALLDLAELARSELGTSVTWVTRGTDLSRVYGGGAADQLAGRGDLGTRLWTLVQSGAVASVTGFAVTAAAEEGGGVHLVAGDRRIGPFDRVIVATGQRPDLTMTRELRLDLDPWLESARALGPLIDPNQHSCGTVYPHGHRELSHPEPGFYTAGIKSYGRAPTFLMMTGYEQVRSIAAALAGDIADADAVRLVLPETGVCSTSRDGDSGTTCCAPAPAVNSCCAPAPKVEEAAICCDPAKATEPAEAATGCCGKAA